MNKKATILISILSILLVILGVVFYKQNTTLKEVNQQFEIEKSALEDEYSELSIQYEGYGLRINNDSLANLLSSERSKVVNLLEELKMTKASNAKKVTALRKELSVLRKVMAHYVAQIDSLNLANTELKKENREVTKKMVTFKKKKESLEKEKEILTKKVNLASILETTNIHITPLSKRNKKTSKIKKMVKIKMDFNINENISASVGNKDIYIRITKPDETILTKSDNNLFTFENSQINYSIKKPIVYSGEQMQVTVYWKVEEFLYPGNYIFDIFADGYIIGSSTLELDD